VERRGKTRRLEMEKAFRMSAWYLRQQPADKLRSQLSCKVGLIRIDRPQRLLESRYACIGERDAMLRCYFVEDTVRYYSYTAELRPEDQPNPKCNLSAFNLFTFNLIVHYMYESQLALRVLITIRACYVEACL